MEGTRPLTRRSYLDWARGLAVLVMIQAHTLDAWTRAADRTTTVFRNATILGGFGAPMFLWLAGLALVFAATNVARRTGSRAKAVDAVCRRGLEIFILAFLFRLQAFVLTPGSHPVKLFRVDILNIMGPALVAAGLIWALGRSTSTLVIFYGSLAAVVAMVTPIIRTAAWVDVLPVWIQWYLRPAGEHTTFTAFPWAGFVFAGAAVGALLVVSRESRAERRLHLWLAIGGAALVTLGFYTAAQPGIYTRSSFWTSSPTYFAIRVGVMMLLLSAVFFLAKAAEWLTAGLRPLERLGRSSLFVYWIHVELVYGYASWLWRGRLPLWGSAIAYVAFCVLMYGVIVLRDRVLDTWRARRDVELAPAATSG